ncbi:hypothetical protein BD769DRAFT_1598281 [Suillus cothurnatus]|nr:hypothetical protein BD769DRAFT_1598281 [Suillus cothurnatus]
MQCQRKDWPTHKSRCHDVERSSGALKFIRMFTLNPILLGLLKIGIAVDCGLIENPRIGFDVPFGVRVDIAIEPSNILDFVELYLNNKSLGEKLQGMLQVNAMTPYELTPERLNMWRKARARHDFAKDPVGLVDFIDVNCTDDLGHSATTEFSFPRIVLDIAKEREPFLCVSAVTHQEKPPVLT